MTKLYSLILLLLVSFTLPAQDFQVVEGKSVHSGRIGSTLKVPIVIQNTSDRTLNIMVKRVDKVIGSSQKTYFCWGNECFTEETEKLPLAQQIAPGATSDDLVSVLDAGLAEGYSTVTYLIYNRDNPVESFTHEVTYSIEDQAPERIIYESRAIRINDVYPNPVTEFALIDYNILDQEVEAKVVIHNVLGSVVSEYELPYLETQVKINAEDFNAGVYFYTLYLDNEGVMSRKLIVRK